MQLLSTLLHYYSLLFVSSYLLNDKLSSTLTFLTFYCKMLSELSYHELRIFLTIILKRDSGMVLYRYIKMFNSRYWTSILLFMKILCQASFLLNKYNSDPTWLHSGGTIIQIYVHYLLVKYFVFKFQFEVCSINVSIG